MITFSLRLLHQFYYQIINIVDISEELVIHTNMYMGGQGTRLISYLGTGT